jgi:glucose-1-phosphate thymidylyltransferase
VIGPHVSLGNHSLVENSIVSNSIVQSNVKIRQANISNSMIGNYAEYNGRARDLSMGDYNQITE